MKNNSMPCEIIRDLMPSYIDGISSEASGAAVREHLKNCEGCRKAYENMSGNEYAYADEEEKAEIDFLKTNRKKGRNRIVTAVIATIAVIMLALGYKGYIAGEICDPSLINYDLSVDSSQITFDGRMIEYDMGVKSIDYSLENGKLDIEVKTTGASPIYRNSFGSSYIPEGEVDEITINGKMIIWCDGEYISPKVSDIFMNRNEYVGDNAKDEALAEAVGIANLTGEYTIELQTEKKPYGWRFVSDMELSEMKGEEIEDRFKTYAAILLAETENLGYVEYEYVCDGKKEVCKVTEEDADRLISIYGGNKLPGVKECGKNAAKLQRMVEALPIYDFSFSSGNLGRYIGGDVSLEICNETDAEIYAISTAVSINEDEKISGGASHADETPLKKGEVTSIAVPAESSINNPEKDKVAISLSVLDKDGKEYAAGDIDLGTINSMKEKYSSQYSKGDGIFEFKIEITGTFEKGFEMEIK